MWEKIRQDGAYGWRTANTCKDMGSETLKATASVALLPFFLGTPTRKKTVESSNIFERDIKFLCSSVLAGLFLAFAFILAFCMKKGDICHQAVTL